MSGNRPNDLFDLFEKISNDFIINEEKTDGLFYKTVANKNYTPNSNTGKYRAASTDTEETEVLERRILDLSYALNEQRRRCAELDKKISKLKQELETLTSERWSLNSAQGETLEALTATKKALAVKKLALLSISEYRNS